MNKMIIKFIVFFSLLIFISCILFAISGCSKKESAVKIQVVESESFFSNFTVKDEKVFITCELVISNLTGKEQTVEIYADFPDDVDLGLLKNTRLKGYYENSEISEIILAEGEQRIRVTFVGEFAGIEKKHDRNLPETIVIIIL